MTQDSVADFLDRCMLGDLCVRPLAGPQEQILTVYFSKLKATGRQQFLYFWTLDKLNPARCKRTWQGAIFFNLPIPPNLWKWRGKKVQLNSGHYWFVISPLRHPYTTGTFQLHRDFPIVSLPRPTKGQVTCCGSMMDTHQYCVIVWDSCYLPPIGMTMKWRKGCWDRNKTSNQPNSIFLCILLTNDINALNSSSNSKLKVKLRWHFCHHWHHRCKIELNWKYTLELPFKDKNAVYTLESNMLNTPCSIRRVLFFSL